ncbi:MAG: RnfABCDGE type electron transport complex subunit G [Clostridia bacterium]|nr:RnfABCDGE type electron transport complex subunit G [Clostridia bacterium]
MKNLKQIMVPAIALFCICLVAALLLGLTNSVTTEKIALIAVETENKARASVFPDANGFSENKSVTLDGAEYSYNEAFDADGNVIGYTFSTKSKGYGGDVAIMTGVNADGTINAIEVLDVSNETPGLGSNAKKDSFKDQFSGMSGIIGVSTASKKAANSIDALTGATYTSNGVTNAVNLALSLYGEIAKGGAVNG